MYLTYNKTDQLELQKMIINTKPISGERFEVDLFFGDGKTPYVCKVSVNPTLRDQRTGEWRMYSTLHLYQGVLFGSTELRDAIRNISKDIVSEFVFLFSYD